MRDARPTRPVPDQVQFRAISSACTLSVPLFSVRARYERLTCNCFGPPACFSSKCSPANRHNLNRRHKTFESRKNAHLSKNSVTSCTHGDFRFLALPFGRRHIREQRRAFNRVTTREPHGHRRTDRYLFCERQRRRPIVISMAHERNCDQRRKIVHVHDSGNDEFLQRRKIHGRDHQQRRKRDQFHRRSHR
jgi:hypothetical protein